MEAHWLTDEEIKSLNHPSDTHGIGYDNPDPIIKYGDNNDTKFKIAQRVLNSEVMAKK